MMGLEETCWKMERTLVLLMMTSAHWTWTMARK
jgi:hypothetical protein